MDSHKFHRCWFKTIITVVVHWHWWLKPLFFFPSTLQWGASCWSGLGLFRSATRALSTELIEPRRAFDLENATLACPATPARPAALGIDNVFQNYILSYLILIQNWWRSYRFKLERCITWFWVGKKAMRIASVKHCWLFLRRSPWCIGSLKFSAISYVSIVLKWKLNQTCFEIGMDSVLQTNLK